jgi:hypothetical protein
VNEYAKQVAEEMQKPVWNVALYVDITASDKDEARRKVTELKGVLMAAPYCIEVTDEDLVKEAE